MKPGGRGTELERGVDPKFYSVRLVGVASDQEGEESTQSVDEEVCSWQLETGEP